MGQLGSVSAPKPRIQLGNCETSCRHITLLAPAESSCKELMNGIVHAIKEGEIERLRNKIVIVLSPKTFLSGEVMMPSYAVLGNLYSRPNDIGIVKGFEWMLKHPHKIVFMLYSLNDFYPDLLHKRPLIRPFTRSKGDVILHNILSGNLFSQARIISSMSLNEKQPVNSIHLSVMPDHCLILEGMTKNSTALPIKELLKDDAKDYEALAATYENMFQGESTKRLIADLASPKGFTIPDKEEKRKVLLKKLREDLLECRAEDERLELYHNVYEGRGGSIPVVQEVVKELDLSELPLHLSDIFPVAFVIENVKRLRVLNLRRCEIDDEKISKIAGTAVEASVKIDEIDLSGNEFAPRTMYAIGQMATHCRTKVLKLWGCGLDHTHMEKLVEASAKLQLTELDVSSNNLNGQGMYFLGKFVRQCKVRFVDASNSNNTDHASLRRFVIAMDDTKVDELWLTDLSLESSFSAELINILPLVRKELCVRGWQISEKARHAMTSILKRLKRNPLLKVHLSHGVELRAGGR